MTPEQIMQAVQDKFGFIVITGKSGCAKGHVIPPGATAYERFTKTFDHPLVIEGEAAEADAQAQSDYIEALNDPDIVADSLIPEGHECYYKAKAE